MPQRPRGPILMGPFCLSRAYFPPSSMLHNSQECERPIAQMRKLRLRRGGHLFQVKHLSDKHLVTHTHLTREPHRETEGTKGDEEKVTLAGGS